MIFRDRWFASDLRNQDRPLIQPLDLELIPAKAKELQNERRFVQRLCDCIGFWLACRVGTGGSVPCCRHCWLAGAISKTTFGAICTLCRGGSRFPCRHVFAPLFCFSAVRCT